MPNLATLSPCSPRPWNPTPTQRSAPRESDVFRLWVTGHGLKYIQNALFVSESTVKSHLRSIYRKCDTHNRAEIIALFERESAELG